MRYLVLGVVGLVLAACSGGTKDSEGFTCELGNISGTWRVRYTETDGDCGPIPDETGIFPAPLPQGCSVQADAISADRCREDRQFTCPTTDGLGTQQWTVVIRHVEPGRLSGTGTVQLDHVDGICRSTYALDITRL